MKKIIGFVGFMESGKGTASDALVENNFVPTAFGNPLKDCVAAIFSWPRNLLEGDTKESREWREKIDPYWAKKLEIPDFTPRKALQLIGTNVLRKHFNDNIWVFCVEKAILELDSDVVVTDVRFPNEIKIIQSFGGKVYRVKRGPEPEWYSLALQANAGDIMAKSILTDSLKIHESEWAWIGVEIDGVFENDGTVSDLRNKVKSCLLQ